MYTYVNKLVMLVKLFFYYFWATITSNGLPCAMGPLSVSLSVTLSDVCNVGVLWPNGWMNQDATWYGPGDIVLDGD